MIFSEIIVSIMMVFGIPSVCMIPVIAVMWIIGATKGDDRFLDDHIPAIFFILSILIIGVYIWICTGDYETISKIVAGVISLPVVFAVLFRIYKDRKEGY